MNNIEIVQKILNKLLELDNIPNISIETDRLNRLWINIKSGYHNITIEMSNYVYIYVPDEIYIIDASNFNITIDILINLINKYNNNTND